MSRNTCAFGLQFARSQHAVFFFEATEHATGIVEEVVCPTVCRALSSEREDEGRRFAAQVNTAELVPEVQSSGHHITPDNDVLTGCLNEVGGVFSGVDVGSVGSQSAEVCGGTGFVSLRLRDVDIAVAVKFFFTGGPDSSIWKHPPSLPFGTEEAAAVIGMVVCEDDVSNFFDATELFEVAKQSVFISEEHSLGLFVEVFLPHGSVARAWVKDTQSVLGTEHHYVDRKPDSSGRAVPEGLSGEVLECGISHGPEQFE